MASSRTPGPIRDNGSGEINDGTNYRQKSPFPGVLAYHPTRVTAQTGNGTLRKSAASIPVLQQGSHGPLVAKLQKLLNTRLQPSPNLKVDGVFGPQTRAAVVQFQDSRSASKDGIVGKQTWYYLLAVPTIAVKPTTSATNAQPSAQRIAPQAIPKQADDVSQWTLEQKFKEMVSRVPGKLTRELKAQFIGLVQLESLAIGLGIFAASYIFGVGELLTIGLLLIIGEQALFELVHAVQTTSLAATQSEIDEGAEHLALFVSMVGVAAFVGWLSRLVPKGRGAKASEKATSSNVPTVDKPSASRSAETRATAPRGQGKSPTEIQLDEMYAKAPNAKIEIDALADNIAKEIGGKVAPAPLKSRDRALEKAIEDYGGDASRVTDLARNTIVVEQARYDKAVELLKAQGAQVKNIDSASNPMGYSGANTVIKTKAGIPAEIQVNTPEMIYAKHKPEVTRLILGKEKYAELAAKSGLPGGRGHQLYEEYRSLLDGDPRAAQLSKESRAYYDHIRKAGGQ